MVALVSLSGVIMPGPMFAATIARGYKDERAGLKISAGHAVIETPLIVAIFLGFGTVLSNDLVFAAIGIFGGLLLLYMGISMLRATEASITASSENGRGSLVTGFLMTAANPYFFLWWATIGAAMVAGAVAFGLVMLPLFAAVHLACDFGWSGFVSFAVFRSKGLWSAKSHRYLFMGAGVIMVFFAIYFLASAALNFA